MEQDSDGPPLRAAGSKSSLPATDGLPAFARTTHCPGSARAWSQVDRRSSVDASRRLHRRKVPGMIARPVSSSAGLEPPPKADGAGRRAYRSKGAREIPADLQAVIVFSDAEPEAPVAIRDSSSGPRNRFALICPDHREHEDVERSTQGRSRPSSPVLKRGETTLSADSELLRLQKVWHLERGSARCRRTCRARGPTRRAGCCRCRR
mgnify:CR=1 FL=1